MIKPFTFSQIADTTPVDELPPLDRESPPPMDGFQSLWREQGVLALEKCIPDQLIDRYKECWMRHNFARPGGWPDATPYMRHDEIKDIALYQPLMTMMKHLIGAEMGLHLNLTGWKSTQRNWHSDGYLNPPCVKNWYIAAWIALDDVHPDSGPFEYVPGSHAWARTSRDRLFEYLPPDMKSRPSWPSESEEAVSQAFESEIVRRGVAPKYFLPKRGDVLLWHAALAHRGTVPKDHNLFRRSLICHYSALSHRHDMPARAQHSNGSWYFALGGHTPV